ncbi:hypothetical protein FDB34_04355 [Clostridium botulinum]|nr:hypothetical protein [Clostridium botulinum]
MNFDNNKSKKILYKIIEKTFFSLITFGAVLTTILSLIGLRGINYYYIIVALVAIIYLLLICRYRGKNILIILLGTSILIQFFIIKSNNYIDKYNYFTQFYGLMIIILCFLDTKSIENLKKYIYKKKLTIYIVYMIVCTYYFILFVTKRGFVTVWDGTYFQAFYYFPHQVSYILTYVQVILMILFIIMQSKVKKIIIFFSILVTILMNLKTGARITAVTSMIILIPLSFKIIKGKYKTVIMLILLIIELILINLNFNVVDFSNLSLIEKFLYSLKKDGGLFGSRSYIWEPLLNVYVNIFDISEKFFGKGFGVSNYLNIYIGNDDIWSHNDFLELALSTGMCNLILYITLLVKLICKYKAYFLLFMIFGIAFINGFFSYFFMSQSLPLMILLYKLIIEI